MKQYCEDRGCAFAEARVYSKGGEGGRELALKVLETLETKESDWHPLYETGLPLKEMIETIAKTVYGAGSVSYTANADRALSELEEQGFGDLPVCIAKTQYSLSDDPLLLGSPEGFVLTVRNVYPSVGAGFAVVQTGKIMDMPGLPASPAALNIDVDDNGSITGLF